MPYRIAMKITKVSNSSHKASSQGSLIKKRDYQIETPQLNIDNGTWVRLDSHLPQSLNARHSAIFQLSREIFFPGEVRSGKRGSFHFSCAHIMCHYQSTFPTCESRSPAISRGGTFRVNDPVMQRNYICKYLQSPRLAMRFFAPLFFLILIHFRVIDSLRWTQ